MLGTLFGRLGTFFLSLYRLHKPSHACILKGRRNATTKRARQELHAQLSITLFVVEITTRAPHKHRSLCLSDTLTHTQKKHEETTFMCRHQSTYKGPPCIMHTIQPTVCPLKHVHTCNLLSCSCSLLVRFRSPEDIGPICQPDKWTYLYSTKEKRDYQDHSVPGTARDVTVTTIIIITTLPPVIGKYILMWEGCLRILVHNCVRVTIAKAT